MFLLRYWKRVNFLIGWFSLETTRYEPSVVFGVVGAAAVRTAVVYSRQVWTRRARRAKRCFTILNHINFDLIER